MEGCTERRGSVGYDGGRGRSGSATLRRAGGDRLQRDRCTAVVSARGGGGGIAPAGTRRGGEELDSPVVWTMDDTTTIRHRAGLRTHGGGDEESLRGGERAQGHRR